MRICIGLVKGYRNHAGLCLVLTCLTCGVISIGISGSVFVLVFDVRCYIVYYIIYITIIIYYTVIYYLILYSSLLPLPIISSSSQYSSPLPFFQILLLPLPIYLPLLFLIPLPIFILYVSVLT